MRETTMLPVLGDDGFVYCPVAVAYEEDSYSGARCARKKILDLPNGEQPDDYYICFTPCGVLERLLTKYATVKATEETTKDYDRWSVHGKGASQGKTYTGKNE